MKKRFRVTITVLFDAESTVLANAIVAQGKSIIIGEFTKHRSQSVVASLVQELRPDVQYDGPEEVLREK